MALVSHHSQRRVVGLMVWMLILGYVFAIRSEHQLCREVQVNLELRPSK